MHGKRMLADRVFKESGVERESCLEILDIPHLHDPNRPESTEFMEALVDYGDYEIFDSLAIRMIMAYRWPAICKW